MYASSSIAAGWAGSTECPSDSSVRAALSAASTHSGWASNRPVGGRVMSPTRSLPGSAPASSV